MFKLDSSSPAINTGESMRALLYYDYFRELRSAAPDIGAAEFKDETAPTITISVPANASAVTGTLSINIHVADDNAIKSAWVDFNYFHADQNLVIGDNNLTISTALGGTAYDLNIVAYAYDWNSQHSAGYDDVWVRTSNTLAGSTVPDFNFTGFYAYVQYKGGSIVSIPFKLADADNNSLLIDLNYSPSATQGTGTVIIDDQNSLTLNCDTNNYSQVPNCSYSWTTPTTDGNFYLLGSASDGNVDFNHSNSNFLLDSTKPVTTSDANSGWKNTDQNVHFTCTDVNSGCDATYFQKDTDATNTISLGAITLYDANVYFPTDGNFALSFFSSDNVDNNETAKQIYILKDSNNAVLTHKYPDADVSSSTESTPTFTFRILDTLSGAKSARFHYFKNSTVVGTYNRFCDVNADNWCNFTVPSAFDEDDPGFMHMDILTDNADNNSSIDINSGIYTYDAVAAASSGGGGGGSNPTTGQLGQSCRVDNNCKVGLVCINQKCEYPPAEKPEIIDSGQIPLDTEPGKIPEITGNLITVKLFNIPVGVLSGLMFVALGFFASLIRLRRTTLVFVLIGILLVIVTSALIFLKL